MLPFLMSGNNLTRPLFLFYVLFCASHGFFFQSFFIIHDLKEHKRRKNKCRNATALAL